MGHLITTTRRQNPWVSSQIVRRKIVNFVDRFTYDQGYPPTVREIAEEVGRVTSVVHWHLSELKDQEVLTWEPGKARTIRLVGGQYE